MTEYGHRVNKMSSRVTGQTLVQRQKNTRAPSQQSDGFDHGLKGKCDNTEAWSCKR